MVAAAEEERFLRIKHWAGLPIQSITYCLQEAGLSLSDVDIISINSDPKANYIKNISNVLRHRVSHRLIIDRLSNTQARKTILQSIEEAFPSEVQGLYSR